MKQFRTLNDIMMERLSDPENAANYLKVCVEEYLDDGDLSFLLKEIKNVIEAQGGINKISKFINISPRELVPCQSFFDGYSLFSLMRASSVVNCHFIVARC